MTASASYVDGRLHRFTVAARHAGDGKVVGTGEVTRVVGRRRAVPGRRRSARFLATRCETDSDMREVAHDLKE